MSPPRLSVCIPTYNRAAALRGTLEHLASLAGLVSEVVVSDNASPDDTPAVAAAFRDRFERFRYARQPANRGIWANWVAAATLATGELMYFLSDDDRIEPRGIAAAVERLGRDPSTVAVYGGYQEWDQRQDVALWSYRPLESPRTFSAPDMLEMLRTFPMLMLPVMRTEVYQRHCPSDRHTFGWWRLVGQLLRHGNLQVIPDYLFFHAQTEPRTEYELTEGWYHDQHRADFEVFIGEFLDLPPLDAARMVAEHAAPAYRHGVRFGQIKDQPLTERHYWMRARAYGMATADEMRDWEARRLHAAALEVLSARASALPGLRRFVVEAAAMPYVAPLAGALAQRFPGVELLSVPGPEFARRRAEEGDFLVADRWAPLAGNPQGAEPPRRIALEDLRASLALAPRA